MDQCREIVHVNRTGTISTINSCFAETLTSFSIANGAVRAANVARAG